MKGVDVIEFYGPGNLFVARAESSMVPTIGSKISIAKKVWEVIGVTYALDYSDNPMESHMRANVDLLEEGK